jgi:NAD-dependent histone deacetylase SIR2
MLKLVCLHVSVDLQIHTNTLEVFDISFFRTNPHPFYTLAAELYPGRYRPTPTHAFLNLLHRKSLLLAHFTQNIDCLDLAAGLPASKTIEAHGSFAKQSCIDCHVSYPEDKMREAIESKEPARCGSCAGLVKPDIVFFGEALPPAFHEARQTLPQQADLCIVMGTSLTVQPFASLPQLVPEECPRILVNMEQVGGLGSRADDVLLLGSCDEGVRKLCDVLGWREELERLWREVCPEEVQEERAPRTKEQEIEDEVEKLTQDVDKSLKLAREHDHTTREELGVKIGKHMSGGMENSEMNSGGPAVSKDGQRRDVSGLDHVFPHVKSNLS